LKFELGAAATKVHDPTSNPAGLIFCLWDS